MSNYKLCNLDTYNHNFGSSVGTIAYHCTEALECPLFNNKTIVPRFMIVYNSPIGLVYNKHKRRSYILIILKSRNFPDSSTR